jgi:arsenate reductase
MLPVRRIDVALADVYCAGFCFQYINLPEVFMSEVTIYHNPRCSKSRQILQLIEEKGISPEIVLYLETPPSVEQLAAVLKKLGISARELLRTKEDAYKESGFADDSLSEQQLLEKMVAFPKVIERPVVVKGDRAVIGRPPENVLELLG